MTGDDATGTPDDDRALALAYLAALGGTDPQAVWSLVAEEFQNVHHALLGAGCTGRDEYSRRLPGFFATFVDRSYEVVDLTVGRPGDGSDGNEVVVDYRFRATVDGASIDIPGVMWISVRDGEITRRLDCWDGLVFHQQTGTTPSLD